MTKRLNHQNDWNLFLVALLVCLPSSATHAVSRAQCRIACADEIASCRAQATSARARRRCRPTWVRTCRTTGLSACQPPTTTSTITSTTTTSYTTTTTVGGGVPYDLTGTWHLWWMNNTCDGVRIVQSACSGSGGYSCQLTVDGCDEYNFPFAPLHLTGTVALVFNPPYGPTDYTASFNLDGPNGSAAAWGNCHVFMDGAGYSGAGYLDGHVSCQAIGQPFESIYFTGTRQGP